MSERCQSPGCGAEVIFVPSAKTGRPMILDAKPTKGVVLRGDLRIADSQPESVASVVDVYTDHHVTCPAAKAWKGRTRKDPPPFPADPREPL